MKLLLNALGCSPRRSRYKENLAHLRKKLECVLLLENTFLILLENTFYSKNVGDGSARAHVYTTIYAIIYTIIYTIIYAIIYTVTREHILY
jgi:hypothetical protein